MAKTETRKILRFRLPQRLVHWLLAVSYLVLAGTGLFLLWSPLSPLAAGGNSRWIHRVAALAFMAVPLLYAILDPRGLKTLLKESFHYDREDLEWFKRSPRYFMGHASKMPPQGHLNAGQKVHHAAIIFSFVTITFSGLVMWFGTDYIDVGGLALMAIIHDLSMLLMTVLTAGHVYFTFVYGALPGMLSGYVSEQYARMEHAKWLAHLSEKEPQSASVPGPAISPQTRAR